MAMLKHDLDQLFNRVRVKLPGAADSAIKAELYDTLQEFFVDSSIWLETFSLNILPNVTDYPVVATQDGNIIRLAGVVDSNNTPQPAIMPNLGTISIQQIPNQAQTFTATVIKTVVLPVTREQIPIAPDWVLPRYGIHISDGIVGKMMLHKNRPYSDAQLGQFHLRRFRDGIAVARSDGLRRNTFGSQAWAYPQGFRTNSQKGGVSTIGTSF